MKHLWKEILPVLWEFSKITMSWNGLAPCVAVAIIISFMPMNFRQFMHIMDRQPMQLPYLEQHVIDNLNGIQMGNLAFFRTTDRKAPHNAYTDAAHLQAGIDAMGYSQEYKEDYTGHYLFAEDGTETVPDGITAAIVKLDNFTDNHPWYEYDAESGEYRRFQYGKEHVDQLDNEQLTCDNIILQYSSCPAYDGNGYLNIDAISGGEGKYITRGKAMDIRWEKDSRGESHYYDGNEQEIRLNPGTTWVEIIQNDRIDSVTYQ